LKRIIVLVITHGVISITDEIKSKPSRVDLIDLSIHAWKKRKSSSQSSKMVFKQHSDQQYAWKTNSPSEKDIFLT